MKKAEKVEVVQTIRERVERSAAILLANNRGMTVEQVSALRAKVREVDGETKVLKNRLFKKAVEGMAFRGKDLDRILVGPTVFIFHGEEGVTPAKVLVDFVKDNEILEIKGAVVDGEVMDAAQVSILSKLPSKPELQSTVLGQVNSLMATVSSAIDNLFSEFAGLVEAQRKALGGEEEAA